MNETIIFFEIVLLAINKFGGFFIGFSVQVLLSQFFWLRTVLQTSWMYEVSSENIKTKTVFAETEMDNEWNINFFSKTSAFNTLQ